MALLALFCTVALASCSSMLGVDDYKDATAELCDLVSACYGYTDCEGHVGPALDKADAAARSDWLASVSDEACLEQCSATRRCLNISPVCAPEGAACSRIEDCCGFLGGTSGCAPTASSQGGDVCCRAKGADCTKDEECCGNQTCSRDTNTCGGVVCAAVGQLCKNDYDCCTNLCTNNRCAESLCTPVDSACSEGDVCCDDASCISGRCGYGACRGEAERCSSTPGEECCESLYCVLDPTAATPTGICNSQNCGPAESPCSTNADCCEGDGLTCDPFKKRCGKICLGTGDTCLENYECCSGTCENGACACSTGACAGRDTDCCAGTDGEPTPCLKGACAPACNTRTCEHNVCSQGGPMSETACAQSPRLEIVKKVCLTDSYCCCVKWDDLCIEQAYAVGKGCI